MEFVVSVEWLHDRLHHPNLVILDASYPKVTGEKSQYEHLLIKGARIFDIDYFSDQSTSLPHMLTSPSQFEEKARELGINQNSLLVIYDNFGIYSAPRAWWMFKVMGHDKVTVLNGGLPDWVNAENPTEGKEKKDFPPGNFTVGFNNEWVRSMEDINHNLESKGFQVVDARSKERFEGTAPEPRPELSSGHIPGSFNVPFQGVVENGFFKSKDKLEEIFSFVNEDKPIAFSCGSGLTACILLMAAEQVLENKKSVYDGSWTEWVVNGGEIEKVV